jgi:hypothetical protein
VELESRVSDAGARLVPNKSSFPFDLSLVVFDCAEEGATESEVDESFALELCCKPYFPEPFLGLRVNPLKSG